MFCFDKDRKIFVGAVNIRHYLNDALLRSGGHIGDGKSIVRNGGVLENEIEDDGHIEQRYWIQL